MWEVHRHSPSVCYWFTRYGKDDVTTVLRRNVLAVDVEECFRFIQVLRSPLHIEWVSFLSEVFVQVFGWDLYLFADVREVL